MFSLLECKEHHPTLFAILAGFFIACVLVPAVIVGVYYLLHLGYDFVESLRHYYNVTILAPPPK